MSSDPQDATQITERSEREFTLRAGLQTRNCLCEERSDAIQFGVQNNSGLLRRSAPRKDGRIGCVTPLPAKTDAWIASLARSVTDVMSSNPKVAAGLAVRRRREIARWGGLLRY